MGTWFQKHPLQMRLDDRVWKPNCPKSQSAATGAETGFLERVMPWLVFGRLLIGAQWKGRVRKFIADPSKMQEEARLCGEPTLAQLSRAREYTQDMREPGLLRPRRLS